MCVHILKHLKEELALNKDKHIWVISIINILCQSVVLYANHCCFIHHGMVYCARHIWSDHDLHCIYPIFLAITLHFL